ncbi:hypothetical protein BAUCODRAFT_32859 [Baudoinia panamericana UAMH 10762]|uniref:Uncharacterized protein n=1 Tax=Baudoinia panamericana (strain UAMH 10762) TaxID=717646 RepID=M2MK97_BAUPA|nr:uncharacterized protein BAUCODRAFT_32859 [Baudoinia panamericana UAMH 10762]EMC97116.1 hypothetical protein BAUCODRAFT_32859 [Baudoinia panamericana UAMH 10762]
MMSPSRAADDGPASISHNQYMRHRAYLAKRLRILLLQPYVELSQHREQGADKPVGTVVADNAAVVDAAEACPYGIRATYETYYIVLY